MLLFQIQPHRTPSVQVNYRIISNNDDGRERPCDLPTALRTLALYYRPGRHDGMLEKRNESGVWRFCHLEQFFEEVATCIFSLGCTMIYEMEDGSIYVINRVMHEDDRYEPTIFCFNSRTHMVQTMFTQGGLMFSDFWWVPGHMR